MTLSHCDVWTESVVLEVASFLLKCVAPAKELHFGTKLCAISINDSGRKSGIMLWDSHPTSELHQTEWGDGKGDTD